MTEFEPQGLSLYMDDCWLAWCLDRAAFDRFHNALNNVFPGEMVFTCEMEDEKSRINFLDLTIIRKENSLEHEFYQKETHSGKYLDYRSHCPESTKLNIIKTETRRVIENCSRTEYAWKYLESLKQNLLRSNYPLKVVVIRMTKEIDFQMRLQSNGNDITTQSNLTKIEYEHVLKIPYVNEVVTRLVKKSIKDLGINARVVPVAGPSLKSYLKAKKENYCSCSLCAEGLDCSEKHVIYEATCKLCNQSYRGVSNRQLAKRMADHEASVRLLNTRTALGTHTREHLIAEDPIPITSDKPDMENLLSSFEIKKIDRGKDSIEAYIKEGLRILETKPNINNKLDNGWLRHGIMI